LAALGLWAAPVQAGKFSAIVLDSDQGRVLYAEDADARRHPASLTKMMTLYLAFEALGKGDISLQQTLKVSRRAAWQAPSSIGLRPGERISVEQAILAAITKSANDAAVVLAEAIAGSESNFAQRMNQRAQALGMSATQFRNATGMPDRRQYTTARDMATLARALVRDFPDYYGFFSERRFVWHRRSFVNHNRLLASYDGADGIKTGYIHASGYNLVASAIRDGKRVIGVVFGGKSASSRDARMAALLDRGFARMGKHPGPATADAGPGEAMSMPSLIGAAKADIPVRADGKDNRAESWSVQVGAFSRWTSAQSQAQKAARSLPSLLEGRDIAIIAGKDRSRIIYRARITGFEQEAASQACRDLGILRLPCVIVPPRT
jgi:D-alanyl-D-alanine carboxypeptidase